MSGEFSKTSSFPGDLVESGELTALHSRSSYAQGKYSINIDQ